jgi:hypothetical protein
VIFVTNNVNWIIDYFKPINLDLRKSKDGTWIDQKCTPDVICFVADCIREFVENKIMEDQITDASDSNLRNITFTIKEIWSQHYAKENIGMFSKPDIEKNNNEYNKFFSQPIKLLNYAQVIKIKGKKGNAFIFTVNNKDLLNFVGMKDINALKFIAIYIEKVLKDSDIYSSFNEFFKDQTRSSFNNMKEDFVAFMKNNTPKGSKSGSNKDCFRIFTKVLNPLSFFNKAKGTISGSLSQNDIIFENLSYNRKNFRDEYIKKPKDVERSKYIISDTDFSPKASYEIEKAKREIKKYNKKFNNGKSECIPELALGLHRINKEKEIEESKIADLATQIHHIFPQSKYPEIANYLENLIALSPTQHLFYAHPYSFDRLVYVLAIGFNTTMFDCIEENNFNDLILIISGREIP